MSEKMRWLEIEDARLIHKNLSGRKVKYNTNGQKRVSVVISPGDADHYEELGWTVKRYDHESFDEPLCYIPCKIGYADVQNVKDPKVWLVKKDKSGRPRKTLLNKDTIGTVDAVFIESVDVLLAPSPWEMDDGTTGVTAWIREMFVNIRQSALENKYDFDDDSVEISNFEEHEVPFE